MLNRTLGFCVLVAFCSIAQADLFFFESDDTAQISGTYTQTVTEFAPNKYDVHIDMEVVQTGDCDADQYEVTVYLTESTDEIRNLTIEATRSTSCGRVIFSVLVSPHPGIPTAAFNRIQNISVDSSSNGDVRIILEEVEEIGSSVGGGSIEASALWVRDLAPEMTNLVPDVFADISVEAGPAGYIQPFINMGQDAPLGDILCDTIHSDGRIDYLYANGNVGTTLSPVTITAGWIERIKAGDIFADIEINGGAMGDNVGDGTGAREGALWVLEAAGDFVGSVDAGILGCSSCADADAAEHGVIIGDELDGMLEFSGVEDQIKVGVMSLGSVIEVNRDVTGTNTAFGIVQTLDRTTTAFDDLDGVINVTGSFNGTIITDGELRGPVLLPSVPSGRTVIIGESLSGAEIDRSIVNRTGEDGRICIAGDLDGTVVLSGDVSARPDQSTTSRILIGGDLDGLLVIGGEFDDYADLEIVGDLGGQIIVGDGVLSDPWDEPITLLAGTTDIILDVGSSQPNQAPFYNALPSVLGGGAVGQVPFNFHPKASTPKPITTKLIAGTYATATIEHYGPVYAATSSAPLVIQHIDCGDTTPAWSSDLSAGFDFVVATSSTTLSRTVTVTPKSTGPGWEKGFYRMSPAAGVLKCANVDGNPAVVYDYTSSTTPSCASSGDLDDRFPVHVISGIGGFLMAMDMDESGWVDSPDAMEWAASPKDIDGDSDADADDLAAIVANIGTQVPN